MSRELGENKIGKASDLSVGEESGSLCESFVKLANEICYLYEAMEKEKIEGERQKLDNELNKKLAKICNLLEGTKVSDPSHSDRSSGELKEARTLSLSAFSRSSPSSSSVLPKQDIAKKSLPLSSKILHIVIKLGMFEVAQKLIYNGTSLSLGDKFDRTPLILLADLVLTSDGGFREIYMEQKNQRHKQKENKEDRSSSEQDSSSSLDEHSSSIVESREGVLTTKDLVKGFILSLLQSKSPEELGLTQHDVTNRNILHYIAEWGDVDLFRQVAKRIAPEELHVLLSINDKGTRNPLSVASYHKKEALVKDIQENIIYQLNKTIQESILDIIKIKDIEKLRTLLQALPKERRVEIITSRYSDNNTLLHRTANDEHKESLKILLDAIPEKERVDVILRHYTYIMKQAIYEKKPEILQIFLDSVPYKSKADVIASCDLNRSIPHDLLFWKDDDCSKILTEFSNDDVVFFSKVARSDMHYAFLSLGELRSTKKLEQDEAAYGRKLQEVTKKIFYRKFAYKASEQESVRSFFLNKPILTQFINKVDKSHLEQLGTELNDIIKDTDKEALFYQDILLSPLFAVIKKVQENETDKDDQAGEFSKLALKILKKMHQVNPEKTREMLRQISFVEIGFFKSKPYAKTVVKIQRLYNAFKQKEDLQVPAEGELKAFRGSGESEEVVFIHPPKQQAPSSPPETEEIKCKENIVSIIRQGGSIANISQYSKKIIKSSLNQLRENKEIKGDQVLDLLGKACGKKQDGTLTETSFVKLAHILANYLSEHNLKYIVTTEFLESLPNNDAARCAKKILLEPQSLLSPSSVLSSSDSTSLSSSLFLSSSSASSISASASLPLLSPLTPPLLWSSGLSSSVSQSSSSPSASFSSGFASSSSSSSHNPRATTSLLGGR